MAKVKHPTLQNVTKTVPDAEAHHWHDAGWLPVETVTETLTMADPNGLVLAVAQFEHEPDPAPDPLVRHKMRRRA